MRSATWRGVARRQPGITAGLIEESIAVSRDGKGKFDQVTQAIRSIGESASEAKLLQSETLKDVVERLIEIVQGETSATAVLAQDYARNITLELVILMYF